jgi:hypothetical protein
VLSDCATVAALAALGFESRTAHQNPLNYLGFPEVNGVRLAYLRDVIERVSTHPARLVLELTPREWKRPRLSTGARPLSAYGRRFMPEALDVRVFAAECGELAETKSHRRFL